MEGIHYVTNEKGERVAVQINLKKFGELWEDFYDNLLAKGRAKEPRVLLTSATESLKKQGKLNA